MLRYAILTVICSLSIFIAVAGQNSNQEQYVRGELLVKFRPNPDSTAARSVNRAMGANAIETLGDTNQLTCPNSGQPDR
ncbi:MAG: hypothetical protein M9893_10735 [Pyrinomonadaceae bacterium]|nr:hypothetical protein [Pyrinomonadaceae bacterium]